MVTFLTIVNMVKYETIVCERLNMVKYITIVSMVKSVTIVFTLFSTNIPQIMSKGDDIFNQSLMYLHMVKLSQ